jgi:sterol desaturase/sphingolipid hydroxylase (fatty acid hydroxylase superfamily)
LLDGVFLNLALVVWFAILALTELYSARRSSRHEAANDGRLLTNFGLGTLVFGAAAVLSLSRVVAAAAAQSLDTGFAPRFALPWLATLPALLLIDSLLVYWTHRLMHRWPLLWRIHRVHHSDEGFDVSTSLRNHPLELIVAVPTLTISVLIVGAPVSIVIAAQTLSLAFTMFQHANIDLPPALDRAIELVLVTPAVHRVHHNPARATHDSNYGELLTLWDRLFGTFNQTASRGPVGLDDQVAPPDQLLQQIWSPVHSA